ncbi:Bifunctional NMN adenylyltransferase/Nudix hydrolase [Actinomyces bovis]|uniref:Bifunctional NMN adenylyltransferase/Nudix hydrolase n=1 Tax=Actinomyces bovis TaxID=1658 RepID=A0ABY1VQC1_9ACTO|nr:NUDIX domain-containing protein [Actinomyces bovis]SPT54334.1 Bifunctional NMN adenylyltransferase/Nudix hydrolase [Actinomyces bovis]VEG56275.1 Bifunctional NMN adenylyltransferase/Nudix hydrolase [Actinomyces israelii]
MPPQETQAPTTAARLPIAVDVVALTVADANLQVLLVDRLLEPFAGMPALPGGFLLEGEELEAAARRELAEETGVEPTGHLEQLRSYGPLRRDPRGPVLSVAYVLFSPVLKLPRAGGDAAAVHWEPVANFLTDHRPLAFDHQQILADGVERARSKIEYSPAATAFCGEEFTVAELRGIYEAVWGTRLDPRNFHRKATSTPGLLEPTGGNTSPRTGRPAALFRRPATTQAGDTVLHPALLRP